MINLHNYEEVTTKNVIIGNIDRDYIILFKKPVPTSVYFKKKSESIDINQYEEITINLMDWTNRDKMKIVNSLVTLLVKKENESTEVNKIDLNDYEDLLIGGDTCFILAKKQTNPIIENPKEFIVKSL